MSNQWKGKINKIDDYRWEIPCSYKPGMRVPGIIYAKEKMLPSIFADQALEQVANVAFLPGIVKYSIGMPDIHWGYGFPIGGVAATNVENGVISPGGIGFDINCGVRMIKTNIEAKEIKPIMEKLVTQLFSDIPTGIGSKGKLSLSERELKKVMEKGSKWAVERGFGTDTDLEFTEENGALEGADPDLVNQKAINRGLPQVGTLGSGNHFIEVQEVVEVFDEKVANKLGLYMGIVTVLIHSGSRGLGHQITTDILPVMKKAMNKYGISVPDQQLACAPLSSLEGKQYLSAMKAAANYAWANRQCLTNWVREVFEKVLKRSSSTLSMSLIYDVAHNIAKIEKHKVNGKEIMVCVHRKGATRAFPPGHPQIPALHRDFGQVIIIPGDMGTASYLLYATPRAMEETFGSTCHGAGRVWSRSEAKRRIKGVELRNRLEAEGIIVRAQGMATLAEETPEAYKDIELVVDSVVGAGLAKKIAKFRPLGVIKG